LNTSFRSTNHIQEYLNYWAEFVRLATEGNPSDSLPYCAKMISGHGFEGIRPETLVFDDAATAARGASIRINDILSQFSGYAEFIVATTVIFGGAFLFLVLKQEDFFCCRFYGISTWLRL
jgi:hypothetical protein